MDSAEHVLTTLLRQYRAGTDLQAACRLLNNHPDNPSLLALSENLSQYNIENEAFKLAFPHLNQLPLPFVAYITSNNGEYVLITALDQHNATITSRNCYEVPMVLSSFELIYGGIVLAMELEEEAAEDSQLTAHEKERAYVPQELPFDITYIDIGASYGLPVKWDGFSAHPRFHLVLVEPDEAQASEIALRYPNAKVLQTGLGDRNEHRDIYLTASQSCSSVLQPNMDVLRRFQLEKWFTVIGNVPANLRRYDDVAAAMNLPAPDFIKIDVQGFEYQVLNGFGNILDEVLCIELETHLLELYKEQKLFFEIHALLYSRGFYLRHLEQAGNFLGEAVEFNAYFVRQEQYLDAQAKAKVAFWEGVNGMPPPKAPRK
jgi:FkbM family methyltransferase